jgi:hypothetical protein
MAQLITNATPMTGILNSALEPTVMPTEVSRVSLNQEDLAKLGMSIHLTLKMPSMLFQHSLAHMDYRVTIVVILKQEVL